MKLFKTSNINNVKYWQECFSFDMSSDLWRKRVTNFESIIIIIIIIMQRLTRHVSVIRLTNRRRDRLQSHQNHSTVLQYELG